MFPCSIPVVLLQGTTNAQVQAAWAQRFHDGGKHVLVAAFGATDLPAAAGADPVATAAALASFVIDNGLGGVDVDYEDTAAFQAGTGEAWLIVFTRELSVRLPAAEGYIITHAPQAPYFLAAAYPNGGYKAVHEAVGANISW